MKIIKRNVEYICAFVIATILFSLLISLSDFLTLYTQFNLNGQILGFAGGLFGLLLTAYAIFFGLVPSINKQVIETDAFGKANRTFLISMVFTIAIILEGIFIFFAKNSVRDILIYTQIFFTLLVIFVSLILVLYLYLLFKITRNDILKKRG
ncbi:MAG: hypothetical protein LUQ65_04860 [Candidatus Helarchaeota archaeon]|nr:hypothetical protein [Candidatus Helarchaeota archaeon]